MSSTHQSIQNQQEAELLATFQKITNSTDRRLVLGLARRTAEHQVPAKPALRLIVTGTADAANIQTKSTQRDLRNSP
jgi:uncharacterized protein (DUF2132 family)